MDLDNPDPPFFHLTERGRKFLANLSRDPSNPEGYLASLSSLNLNPVANSYIREALACFMNNLPKAAAVMVGGASESIALELRNAVIRSLKSLKRVLDTMYTLFEHSCSQMPQGLRDSFKSYWLAFVQQIRAARNEAGHPSSVDPVTMDTVHASLLTFPELYKLTGNLLHWISCDYK